MPSGTEAETSPKVRIHGNNLYLLKILIESLAKSGRPCVLGDTYICAPDQE